MASKQIDKYLNALKTSSGSHERAIAASEFADYLSTLTDDEKNSLLGKHNNPSFYEMLFHFMILGFTEEEINAHIKK